MTIDGVNNTQKAQFSQPANNPGILKSFADEKPNTVFSNGIKAQTELDGEISYIPSEQKTEEPEQMSRKEAKKWLKEYRKENDCSRKEAKAAFEKEFGYKVPSSMLMKGLRANLIGIIPIAGFLALTGDAISNGKLGIQRFIETGSFKKS